MLDGKVERLSNICPAYRHILAWRSWQGGRLWELLGMLFLDQQVDEVLALLSLDADKPVESAKACMYIETLTFVMQTIALEAHSIAQQGMELSLETSHPDAQSC